MFAFTVLAKVLGLRGSLNFLAGRSQHVLLAPWVAKGSLPGSMCWFAQAAPGALRTILIFFVPHQLLTAGGPDAWGLCLICNAPGKLRRDPSVVSPHSRCFRGNHPVGDPPSGRRKGLLGLVRLGQVCKFHHARVLFCETMRRALGQWPRCIAKVGAVANSLKQQLALELVWRRPDAPR